MSTLLDNARHIFANDLYATRQTGVEIEQVENDSVVCGLTLTDSHRNAKGAVMGGVMFTLADLAFAIAANIDSIAQGSEDLGATVGDHGQLHWVSTTSTIHFMSSPKGSRLTATAQTLRRGRTQVLVQVAIADDTGRQVALVTTTGNRV